MSRETTVILRLLLILGTPLLLSVLMFLVLWQLFLVPVQPDSTEKAYLLATADKSFVDLCQELEEQGVVRKWYVLSLLAKIRGSKTTVRAGEYEVSPSMTPKEILAHLLSGQLYQRVVEFLPGMTMAELAAALDTAGVIKATDFLKSAQDQALLTRAGVRAESFQGFLLPGKYRFSRGERIFMILFRMLEQSEKFWVSGGLGERVDQLGFTRTDTLILASIIQSESDREEDLPKISSVFHNRLRNGMRLNSLATLRFALNHPAEGIRRADLTTNHPYNTFVNYGLPPGAINNPGPEAILAALHPEETTFLFFISDGVGGHQFARTEREYEDALLKYGSPFVD